MDRPPPTARAMLGLHVAAGVPLVALAVWFGAIDRLPFGAGRCGSCGVEGYVVAAHAVAALWLGAVVAATATARRRARGDAAAGPDRRTLAGLAAAAGFGAAALAWHPLFSLPALAAMVVSLLLAPAGGLWWVLRTAAWLRRAPDPGELTGSLTAAWLALAVLLPALFGWIWTDRVEWIVF
jgi:hypothetical protein